VGEDDDVVSRRMKTIVGITSIAILVCVVSIVVALVITRRSPQLISEAKSPDDTWSIAVIAKPRFGGSYDIVANVKDADSKVVRNGAFVIGLTSDLESAREVFAITFDSNDLARIGERRMIERSRFFP
jgi:hypothetical protein